MTVAAWAGSTNLGDELLLAALVAKLRRRGLRPHVLSVDPGATSAAHDVSASTTRGLVKPPMTRSAGVLLGGGGLLQDETSPFNLPFHLGRAWLAAAPGRPFAGIGLGAGPLSPTARRVVRRALSPAVAVSVRDLASQDLLRSLGVPSTLAADLAVSLPAPQVRVEGRVAVALRPWTGARSMVPVERRRTGGSPAPEWFVPGMAAALDQVADRTGLALHFVALQRDRDDAVHRAVADRMRATVTFATPDLDTVVAEVAACEAVIAMRYHAGIAALLGGRPAVLIGYSSKVASLAADVPGGMKALAWGPAAPGALADALVSVVGATGPVCDARERLRSRELGNDVVIDRLLEAASAR